MVKWHSRLQLSWTKVQMKAVIYYEGVFKFWADIIDKSAIAASRAI